jgi:hypothetical protein
VASFAAAPMVRRQLSRLLSDSGFSVRVLDMRDKFLRYDRERICERILTSAAAGYPPYFESNLSQV